MMKQQRAKPAFRRFTGLWLTLFAVFFAGFIWVMLSAVEPEMPISYSSLIEQIRAGNVAIIQISGDEVTGSFANRMEWSRAADGSTAHQNSGYAAGSYSVFRTNLPSPLDTSTLLSLLAEYKVAIGIVLPPMARFILALKYVFPLGLLFLVAGWVARQFTFVPYYSTGTVR